MFVYCAVCVLVLVTKGNAGDIRVSKASVAGSAKHDRIKFNIRELARLIHTVNQDKNYKLQTNIYDENDASYNKDDGDGDFSKRGKLNKNMNAKIKLVHVYGVGQPRLDLDYFDINKLRDALESSNKGKIKINNHNDVPNKAETNADNDVRIHFIENPDVLEQFNKEVLRKHTSTSSDDDDNDDYDEDSNTSDSYDNDRLVRRNAMFRDKPSKKPIPYEYPKLALRNNINAEYENDDQHSKDNGSKEIGGNNFFTIPNSNEDIYDKQHKKKDNHNNQKGNRYVIIKTDGDDNYKNDEYTNDYKNSNNWKGKSNDNYEKDKYDDYENDNYNNNNNDPYKNNKNNIYDNKYDKDWNDEVAFTKSEYKDINSGKVDQSEENSEWDKPNKKDTNLDTWKPESQEQVQERRDTNIWDKPNKQAKVAETFERKHKEAVNEWDMAMINRGDTETYKPKSFVPKIADYYDPKPRIHKTQDREGAKRSFGRTSIPFVGKKRLYENK